MRAFSTGSGFTPVILPTRPYFCVQLLGLEHGAVHAAKADGLAAQPVELGHQVLVDLAAQHALDHVHGLLVGVAQAVHKVGLVADLLEHGGDLRPAAVDHHHPDAHQGQEDDVTHDGLAELVGDHGVAAVFDDDGFAGEFLNIGQGLHQSLGLLRMGGHVESAPFVV